MVVVLVVVVVMVMEGKASRHSALGNIYVPESPARVEFCANRNCVHLWSRIYIYTRDSSLNWDFSSLRPAGT